MYPVGAAAGSGVARPLRLQSDNAGLKLCLCHKSSNSQTDVFYPIYNSWLTYLRLVGQSEVVPLLLQRF